ncbi:MAG TPA: hypothetical protein VLK89_04335 [Solirubrobacterales bacterium]|nr:hypothetical protein [Solirubrobacterales bacterium]
MAGRFAAAVWEFVVGDDWRVALGTVLTLGATALIAAAGLPAWWLAPVAVLAVLYRSVRRAAAQAPAEP